MLKLALTGVAIAASGVVGAGLAGVDLLTAFPYFAAIALIVGSGVALAGQLFRLLLYCVVYTLPLTVQLTNA